MRACQKRGRNDGTSDIVVGCRRAVGKLIAFDLILRFAAGVVEPLGVSGISDMLMKISKCAGLLIAAIAGATFAFFAMVLTAGTSVGV